MPYPLFVQKLLKLRAKIAQNFFLQLYVLFRAKLFSYARDFLDIFGFLGKRTEISISARAQKLLRVVFWSYMSYFGQNYFSYAHDIFGFLCKRTEIDISARVQKLLRIICWSYMSYFGQNYFSYARDILWFSGERTEIDISARAQKLLRIIFRGK